MIPIVLDCPRDKICEHIKDGAIHRCRSFMQMSVQNPQTGEDVLEWNCWDYHWQPMIILEQNKESRSLRHAVISLREETVKRQDKLFMQVSQGQVMLLSND